ncbi:cytochrome c-type biogenesis protein [Aurantiacibacter spongiae]|uniref:cytochrome c-type biogenesis protein n=1 Tax=Aurantiacibacter spongiae TaxID=2488860 RepID=UPI001F2D9603|nr:cytochrome c-type biogenesis protein [Aurantiacibacter spongiae]
MTFRICLLTALALLAEPLAAQGNLPPAPYAYTELADPAQEREARELMETLRCLTCQSQSIADSDAAMAGDMRHQVRTRIAAGESPDHIREWMVARYGDYISYEPRLAATTWPLFALPVLLLVLSGLIVWRRMGARRGE